MKEELRPLLHELANALTIASGLTQGALSGLKGEMEVPPEQIISKLERAIKALERIERTTVELKNVSYED